jgi:ketosteroid isomerase-like protein
VSVKRTLGVLALILLSAPAMPALSATQAAPGITAGTEDPMVTDTRKLIDTFVQLWKENKLEQLVAGYFTEDPLMLPPNHEPIRGHQAILAYFKSLRDAVGEFDRGDGLIRATPSGDDSVSWVGQFSFHDGKLRVTTHELFVRQPDGSMRCAVKMVGFRDPMA